VERIQSGEVKVTPDSEQLFRKLVREHEQRLYRFVLKHIGHSDDAEDIAQQAFVEAARAYSTFRGESELSTWLYGIAMNLVRNYLSRAPHRVHQFETEEALEEHADGQATPDEQAERMQMVAHLSRELEALPAEMREVLLLVALEELSYEEAAALLSIPIGTVRSRVSRARTALRTQFENAGISLPFA
jgi:RNA polymerase sigma factor (sigma-70 family)